MTYIKRLGSLFSLMMTLVLCSCTSSEDKLEDKLPACFDLRTSGPISYITPVKTQAVEGAYWNNVGLCWAFAALASFESSLLIQGIVTEPKAREANLSAWHLGNHNGYNHPNLAFNETAFGDPPVPVGYALDDTLMLGWGGSVLYAIDWLSEGYGLVLEDDAPLPLSDMAQRLLLTPPAKELAMHYMLRSGLIYERERYGSEQAYRHVLKKAIMKHGAAASPMYLTIGDIPGQAGLTYFRNAEITDYYVDDPELENHLVHMVTIIGWHDNYQIDGAPNPGAWIIKNSMGSQIHDDGYMMIAYDDTVFLKGASYAVILVGDDGDGYDRERYQTHEGILSLPVRPETMYQSIGFIHQQLESWGSVRFVARNNHHLKAVGMVTMNDDEAVHIIIHQGFDVRSGAPQGIWHEEKLTVRTQGYHVIDLAKTVSLEQGSVFHISIGFAAGSQSEQPLVYVVNENRPNIEWTRMGSRQSDGTYTWVPTHELVGHAVFYVQGIVAKD